MKLYLAAYETQLRAYGLNLDKKSNLFLTYFYRAQTEKSLDQLAANEHSGLLTIDSGAHSFFELMGISVTAKHGKVKNPDLPDPDAYFQKYKAWLVQWKDKFDYFCELDLQELVGMEKILDWRRQFCDAGLGDQMITVHHSCNNWGDYEQLIANTKSGYIAIEGVRKGAALLPYNKFIKYAYDKDIKIHGFAFTRSKLLYHFPFYSVDSSSWTAAPRYGILNKFNGVGIKCVKPTKEHYIEHQVPIHLHNKDTSKAANRTKLEWSALQYQQLEVFFTDLWKARGIDWRH